MPQQKPPGEFSVNDINGDSHRYVVQKPHPPFALGDGDVSGNRLLRHVGRSALTPISEFVNSNIYDLATDIRKEFGTAVSKAKKDALAEAASTDHGESEVDVKIMDVLDYVELDKFKDTDLELPRAVTAFFDATDAINFETVVSQLFRYTRRDDEQLHTKEALNRAYAGNMYEMYKSAYHVCRYNGFFGSLGTGEEKSETDPEPVQ